VVIPLVATILSFVIGGVLGLYAGFREGALDIVVARGMDVLLAVPPLLVVLVIVAAFGSSPAVVVISVTLVYIPQVTRVIRGATQGVARREFVLAAQARGERGLSIVLREIAPNITSPILVEFALRLTWAIIFVATLTFLGLGVQPPSSNWALMVSESRSIITLNPLAALAPAIAIGLLSVGVSMIADAVASSSGGERHREYVR
jgi:peptide/nickel transport system permease protein